MSTDTPVSRGAFLDAWLAHLDGRGFRIGIRERLVVQRLLATLAARGELPAQAREMLLLLMPLLCTRPEQQRNYRALLDDFDPLPAADTAASDATALHPLARLRARSRSRLWSALVVLVVLLIAVSLGRFFLYTTPEDQPVVVVDPAAEQRLPTPNVGTLPTSAGPGSPATAGSGEPIEVYVSKGRLPIAVPEGGAWRMAVRLVLVAVGVFAATLLVGQAWLRRNRQLYLQGVRSDEEVEQHLLHDHDPQPVGPPAAAARAVARGLRQRMAGESLALDIVATLRASMQAGGGLAPRWRVRHHTPEYLALVDKRHTSDHHSAYAQALLVALADAGVALQVYHFEGSPESGCWPAALPFDSDAARARRIGFADLATRRAGHRLLVFGHAEMLFDEFTGEPRRWTTSFASFVQRAWFTPMPLNAWGSVESAADALGFLVLPQQAAALNTLANWLASERLGLAVEDDWPLTYPAMLRHEGAAWAARQQAPSADTLAELMFQLRAALGPLRLRWLWACAVFPALTPPLTLALGREVMPDARTLALGMSALCALPWFRFGHMPDWLREALLAELAQVDPALEGRLRHVLMQRLESALEGGQAPVLAEVAKKRRRLAAWLGRGRGPARDLVMVQFLQRDMSSRLLLRLPEGLRRRLFKNGLPALGLRLPVLAWALVLSAVALAASWGTPWPLVVPLLVAAVAFWRAALSWASERSPRWRNWWFQQGEPRQGLRWLPRLGLGLLTGAMLLTTGSAMLVAAGIIDGSQERLQLLGSWQTDNNSGTAIDFSPDGLLVYFRTAAGGVGGWDLRSGVSRIVDGISPPAFRAVVSANDEQLRVEIQRSSGATVKGKGTDGRWRQIDAVRPSSLLDAATSLALSPDGRRLAVANGDGGLYILGRGRLDGGAVMLALIDCAGARTINPRLRALVDASVVGGEDDTPNVVAYLPASFERVHGAGGRPPFGSIVWSRNDAETGQPPGVAVVKGWLQKHWPGPQWTESAAIKVEGNRLIAVGTCEANTSPVQQKPIPVPEADDLVVRIGHVAPLSGGIAHLGKDNENGARMAIDELNAKGVTIGGKKAKFELIAEDDASDPKQGIAVASKLVDAKVNGVIGHLNSGTSIPASKIYSDAGIPQISPSATNPKFTRQGFATTFRVVADDAELAGTLGRYAVKDLKGKSIVTIDDRTAYGQGVAEEFAKAVRASGGAIEDQQFTTDRATDFTAILTAVKAKKPDIVLYGGMDTVAGPMIRQMKQLGITAKFLGGDGICTGELPKLSGGAMADNQVVCAEVGGVEGSLKAGMDKFREDFKRKFNVDVQIYAPYVYDAVNVMVAAMVKAGSADPAKYLPVLAKTEGYKGVTGIISFDAKGDVKNGALTLYTYKGDRREQMAVVR